MSAISKRCNTQLSLEDKIEPKIFGIDYDQSIHSLNYLSEPVLQMMLIQVSPMELTLLCLVFIYFLGLILPFPLLSCLWRKKMLKGQKRWCWPANGMQSPSLLVEIHTNCLFESNACLFFSFFTAVWWSHVSLSLSLSLSISKQTLFQRTAPRVEYKRSLSVFGAGLNFFINQ